MNTVMAEHRITKIMLRALYPEATHEQIFCMAMEAQFENPLKGTIYDREMEG